MCYFLTIATPLTLSEVRSMLPRGLAAQPTDSATTAAFRRLHPPSQTVAVLLSGACSCDLVRPRHPDPREDERHLRSRYFREGHTRARIVRALERHRRQGPPDPFSDAHAGALAAFVIEHARNAGPTLYHLRFALDPEERVTPEAAPPIICPLRAVRERPEGWIGEGPPVLVVR